MELQFNLTPADASQVKIYYIVTLCIGFFVGGIIVKVMKLKDLDSKYILKFL